MGEVADEIDAALAGGPPPSSPVSLDGLDRAVDRFELALVESGVLI